ncbi:MAG: acetate uptake transporter family protein [Acidobacteriaceae bacterium]
MTSAAPVIPVRTEVAEPRAEVLLQPIAAPSILGLYGFAAATFMVAANIAHWYGGATSPEYLAPFAALFGGVAQFSAGMWSYKARDGLASAMHGMWGSFWIAYGLLNLGFITGALHKPAGAFPGFAYWFIGLAAITWVGCFAATAASKALTAVLGFLAAGSTAMAVGQFIGSDGWDVLAAYLFIVSAVLAWYTASALMLEGSFGRAVWPVGKSAHAASAPKFNPGVGEPGVIQGQ